MLLATCYLLMLLEGNRFTAAATCACVRACVRACVAFCLLLANGAFHDCESIPCWEHCPEKQQSVSFLSRRTAALLASPSCLLPGHLPGTLLPPTLTLTLTTAALSAASYFPTRVRTHVINAHTWGAAAADPSITARFSSGGRKPAAAASLWCRAREISGALGC